MPKAEEKAGKIMAIGAVSRFLMFLSLCMPSLSSSSQFFDYGSERKSPALQEAAASGVLKRLLHSHVSAFQLSIISEGSCGGSRCFWIKNGNPSENGSKIRIEGTTGVEIASGLHWYLKYWCGAHISWDKTGGVQLSSVPPPDFLPPVQGGGLMLKRPVPWSYYQNVVTSSYSFVWWDWRRWEKEIDWMALQGINLPLAFTGQEAIWQKVFKGFNVSEEDMSTFFGGPAFLAWARMGNLHSWGGPLPQNWLNSQLHLQKSILSRMRDLGMSPVLPAFSGNVPGVIGKIFPSANISRLGNWNTIGGDSRWCCTYLLDPSDPLFVRIGKSFIDQQTKEYGDITNIYNCDTFNENSPPSDDPAYIASLGASIYRAMYAANKNAIWLMQGWLFSSDAEFWKPQQMKALLHSVPVGKMIVLDLFADVKPIWKVSSHFYGVPYIWCMLHNFGGNIEMYGILDTIASDPIDSRESQNSTMIGVGMCMEGIEQNPVVYDLMSEMAFRSEKVQLEKWVKNYSQRRYGKSIPEIEMAWKILHRTIYNCTDGIADHNRDIILEFPDRSPYVISKESGTKISDGHEDHRLTFREIVSSSHSPHLWYSTDEVINALCLFLLAGEKIEESHTYRYDLVDLTRQVLSKIGNQLYLDAIKAYKQGDSDSLSRHSGRLIELIEDLDTLLSSDDNFLLGTWLENAKSLATSQEERKQYEWNARTQVTMWFDNTETNQSKLHDYANKYWSGLLREYYLPRASTYFKYLIESLKEEVEFPLEKWRSEWISYSNKWQAGDEIYPVNTVGNSLAIAKDLASKYLNL
ncbi:alpha-N-acetylglucosaminidase family / NAGLU family [Wolffia australiana]